MLGQWRKCLLCGKKFRLTGKQGIIRTRYNYVTLEDKSTKSFKYAHRKCYNHFIKTKPKYIVSELKGGFNIKKGLFVEGKIKEE